MKKALDILYRIDKEYKFGHLDSKSCVESDYIKEAIKELEELENRKNELESQLLSMDKFIVSRQDEFIKELNNINSRSCSNCDDFDNEMDCDEFGFCTNNENNKDFKGYDWVRTKSNFCCNNWKNKA